MPTVIEIPEINLPEEEGYSPETGIVMQCPVRLGLKRDGSDLWTLPIEALVSGRGRKNIIISNVLKKKRQGSVKELWSIDDYEITITGSLYSNEEGVYPSEQVARMKKIVESQDIVTIQSLLTDAIGVRYVVAIDWDFPTTKGVEWQDYSVRFLSDVDHELIEPI